MNPGIEERYHTINWTGITCTPVKCFATLPARVRSHCLTTTRSLSCRTLFSRSWLTHLCTRTTRPTALHCCGLHDHSICARDAAGVPSTYLSSSRGTCIRKHCKMRFCRTLASYFLWQQSRKCVDSSLVQNLKKSIVDVKKIFSSMFVWLFFCVIDMDLCGLIIWCK